MRVEALDGLRVAQGVAVEAGRSGCATAEGTDDAGGA